MLGPGAKRGAGWGGAVRGEAETGPVWAWVPRCVFGHGTRKGYLFEDGEGHDVTICV